ncbi:ribonuclease [Devosia sp. J2-20]|uniref:ribonuclease T2 family protein n=1 Tax=Devosia sp. J2-20 TaxID=3026161 RepID=UPI00249A380C|nr:ribonuclease [Devosia sp. J2-20]WDQ99350.1 ribonuclease [Devosia sp. J2-20]
MARLLLLVLLTLLVTPARAEVPLTGTFTASQACPALQSIRKQTNPGNILTHPGNAYELLAANADRATHYWIIVPDAQPKQRWVAIECGSRSGAAGSQATGHTAGTTAPAYRGTQYVLAINWQPAFCEISSGKPECGSQTTDSFEATHFTLHGLWPQPRNNEYCDVSHDDQWASQNGRWRDLPAIPLSDGLRRDLDTAMPGTMSALDRHEWTKHGTCYGTSQEEYFADSLDLLLAINTSAVAELFAANIGKKVTLRQIRTAFDQAFGPGSGERVSMDCAADGNRTIITELTIALTGTINGPDDLSALLAAASPASGGCSSGMVDPVGLR